MKLRCFYCGSPVTNELPDNVVFEAIAECPDCMHAVPEELVEAYCEAIALGRATPYDGDEDDTRLHELSGKGLTISGQMVGKLAAFLAQYMTEQGAKNYVQANFWPKRGGRKMVMTVAWKDGKTPEALAYQLAEENEQLRQQIAQLKGER